MEIEKKIMQMEILNTKVIILMINMKKNGNIFLKRVNIIQVNGKMVQDMEIEKKIIQMEILNIKRLY